MRFFFSSVRHIVDFTHDETRLKRWIESITPGLENIKGYIVSKKRRERIRAFFARNPFSSKLGLVIPKVEYSCWMLVGKQQITKPKNKKIW